MKRAAAATFTDAQRASKRDSPGQAGHGCVTSLPPPCFSIFIYSPPFRASARSPSIIAAALISSLSPGGPSVLLAAFASIFWSSGHRCGGRRKRAEARKKKIPGSARRHGRQSAEKQERGIISTRGRCGRQVHTHTRAQGASGNGASLFKPESLSFRSHEKGWGWRRRVLGVSVSCRRLSASLAAGTCY